MREQKAAILPKIEKKRSICPFLAVTQLAFTNSGRITTKKDPYAGL
ncbi:hypothetical protein AB9R84_15550 [Oceanimonas smirnovii]